MVWVLARASQAGQRHSEGRGPVSMKIHRNPFVETWKEEVDSAAYDGGVVVEAQTVVTALAALDRQMAAEFRIGSQADQIEAEHGDREVSIPLAPVQQHEPVVLGVPDNRRSPPLDFVYGSAALVAGTRASEDSRTDCHNAKTTKGHFVSGDPTTRFDAWAVLHHSNA